MNDALERARLDGGEPEVTADGPGLMTVERVQQLFRAGRMTAEALERSMDIALRRRPRTQLGCLTNEQIDRLPEVD